MCIHTVNKRADAL